MLETLRINNFVIINDAEVSFQKGLNVLSGETGTGKSIVIEAISLLLGSRAGAHMVRTDAKEAQIEGLFDIKNIPWIGPRLETHGYEHKSNQLLIKRIINNQGKHRIFINGELATLAILEKIAEGLVDLCSQHEHQSLLRTGTQMDLLDKYAGHEKETQGFRENLTRLREIKKELDEIENTKLERNQKLDFLKFQIDEIKKAAISDGEDEGLQAQKQTLKSAEKRISIGKNLTEILDNEEQGNIQLLRRALGETEKLLSIDPKSEDIHKQLERALMETEEASLKINRYFNTIESDPKLLEEVEDRLSLISDLKRKFGPDAKDIKNALKQFEEEKEKLINIQDRVVSLQKEHEDLLKILKKAALALSNKRKKIAVNLQNLVTKELSDLNMKDAKFIIDITHKDEPDEWSLTLGPSSISFIIKTNEGEKSLPIGKIASGGELSRIMLAIRRVLSQQGGVGVYLFDEIDSGIGGQTAFEVGKKLKSVSLLHQVICITHLPQVASFADHHLSVRKRTEKKRTLTEIQELKTKEKIEELARMLGGPKLSPKSIDNAKELVTLAQKSL